MQLRSSFPLFSDNHVFVFNMCIFLDLSFSHCVILCLQEKRKTRKALEVKKVLEAKLEASDQR